MFYKKSSLVQLQFFSNWSSKTDLKPTNLAPGFPNSNAHIDKKKKKVESIVFHLFYIIAQTAVFYDLITITIRIINQNS